MFDRLATDVRNREESARSLAAARKSVFDRLRGECQKSRFEAEMCASMRFAAACMRMGIFPQTDVG